MKVNPNQLFHIYNQGNNRERLFYERADYIAFLTKYREFVQPFCETVAYCLMPNHFHFILYLTDQSTEEVMLGVIKSTKVANGFRLLCSGYANDCNKKYGRTGSLFRQKTQAKNLEETNQLLTYDYPLIGFHYVHQNPMVAKLCKKMEDWEFSSFRDYNNQRKGTLINKSIAFDRINVSEKDFYRDSYEIISEDKYRGLFL
jgi:putative transposase